MEELRADNAANAPAGKGRRGRDRDDRVEGHALGADAGGDCPRRRALDGGAGVVDARLAGHNRETRLRRELGGQEVGVGPAVDDEQGGDPADLGLDHGRMDR